jgi:hypothetical protein
MYQLGNYNKANKIKRNDCQLANIVKIKIKSLK